MDDHDQRLKSVFQLFLPELLELFFSTWAKRLDAHAALWIDKEIFPAPPDGRRRFLDLLAKVPIRPGVAPLPRNVTEMLALVHIEIESAERTTEAKEQLWQAYSHLRGKYRLPVLPIAVYLNVGLDGIGIDERVETFADLDVVTFRYLYVGLRALDGLQYLKGESLLGVALSAHMRVPEDQLPVLGATAIERIAVSSLDDQRKYLLAECVEAYLPLTEEGRKRFEELIGSSDFKGAKVMNKTSRELGREEGLQEGLQAGARNLVAEQLQERFGRLSDEVVSRLRALNEQEVTRIGKALLKAQSLKELGLE